MLLSPRVGYRSKKAPDPQHLLAGVVQNCSRAVLRILIYIHPGSKISNKRGAKKKLLYLFFVATNITKLKIILFLNWQRKIWFNLQRIIKIFPQKLSLSSQNMGFDPGSEIRDPRKNLFLVSGSRGQKGTGSRIRNTARRGWNM